MYAIDFNKLKDKILEQTQDNSTIPNSTMIQIRSYLIQNRSIDGIDLDNSKNDNFTLKKKEFVTVHADSTTEEHLISFLHNGPSGLGIIGHINLDICKHNIPPHRHSPDYRDHDGAPIYMANVERMFSMQNGFIYIGVHTDRMLADNANEWLYVPLNFIEWDDTNLYGLLFKYCGAMGLRVDVLDEAIRYANVSGWSFTTYNTHYSPQTVSLQIKSLFPETDCVVHLDPDDSNPVDIKTGLPIWSLPTNQRDAASIRHYKAPKAVAWIVYKVEMLQYLINKLKRLDHKPIYKDRIEILENVCMMYKKEVANMRADVLDALLRWSDGTSIGLSKAVYEISGRLEKLKRNCQDYGSRISRITNPDSRTFHVYQMFSTCYGSSSFYNWLTHTPDEADTLRDQPERVRRVVSDVATAVYSVKGLSDDISELRDLSYKMLPSTYSTLDFLYWLHKTCHRAFCIYNGFIHLHPDSERLTHAKNLLKAHGVTAEPWYYSSYGILSMPMEAFHKVCLPNIYTKRYTNIQTPDRCVYSPRGYRLKSALLASRLAPNPSAIPLVSPGMFIDGLQKCGIHIDIREKMNNAITKGGNDGS